MLFHIVLFLLLALSNTGFANSTPVVSNVKVSPRTPGSSLIDITYDLADTDGDICTISVVVSDKSGTNYNVKATSFSGDVGADVAPSNEKHIIWNSGSDLPEEYGKNHKVRIVAADVGIDWVYVDDPGISGHEGFTGYMSKYETTNAQYCQFLNAAKASGDVTVKGNLVKGAKGSNKGADFTGKVYYNLTGKGYDFDGATNGGAARIHYVKGKFIVDAGFEKHPVTYVSWYGATAFCNYYGFRLPTEWEWHAVADYDGTYISACGRRLNNKMANYKGSEHPDGTTVVGSYGPCGYGLSDMAGNVWEWTSTYYGTRYRVLRSGSWTFSSGFDCIVELEISGSPGGSYDVIGFRVCR